MTPTQISFLRDFAIDNLPRAKLDREKVNRYGGNLSDRLAFTAVMVRGKSGTTAIEYAAADVLELVCLLHHNRLSTKERHDTLKNLFSAAHALCFHAGKTIPWLGDAPPPEPAQEQPPAPAKPLPSIAGKFLSTKEAAKFLKVAEQTLRSWSSNQTGPIQPTKLGRALRWSGDDILAVLRGPVCVSKLRPEIASN